jgi:hypothetical protein
MCGLLLPTKLKVLILGLCSDKALYAFSPTKTVVSGLNYYSHMYPALLSEIKDIDQAVPVDRYHNTLITSVDVTTIYSLQN